MKGVVPIYHGTDDQRILAYLNKNVRTHELATGKQSVRQWELDNQFRQVPLSSGRIRGFLSHTWLALLALGVLYALVFFIFAVSP